MKNYLNPLLWEKLTQREKEVCVLFTKFECIALSNQELGERLGITKKTFEKHMASIYDKLGIRSRAQLVYLVSHEEETAIAEHLLSLQH